MHNKALIDIDDSSFGIYPHNFTLGNHNIRLYWGGQWSYE